MSREIVASPAVIVLIDARNVLRSRWPNLPADELVERAARWARARAFRAVLVFDGQAPGGVVGERVAGDEIVSVGTGGESADDWIVARAAALASRGEPYWLVTSDRAVRDAAGDAAERTIGGGAFVAELGAARPRRKAPHNG
jgi:predicted RNA-binding protein with PIN domain